MSDGLTPEEIKFFETGDASHLQGMQTEAPAPAPAPVNEPDIEPPAPAPAPAPADAPAPAPAPNLSVDEVLRQQFEAERRSRQQLEARLAELAQKLNPPAPAPAPAPDVEKDPLGHLLHKLNQVVEEVSTLKSGMTQDKEVQAQQAEFTQFVTQMRAVRDEFTKTTPDFPQAYAHLRAARADDLRDVGVPEDRIAQALMQDEIAVSHNAVQQGKNPAQVIYNMAKRYGYSKTAAAPPTSPEARLQNVAQGQAADTQPPPKQGAEQPITLKSLKDVSDKDLDKFVRDNNLWHKVIGNTSDDIFG